MKHLFKTFRLGCIYFYRNVDVLRLTRRAFAAVLSFRIFRFQKLFFENSAAP